jgi:hypothetical protein
MCVIARYSEAIQARFTNKCGAAETFLYNFMVGRAYMDFGFALGP